MTLVVIWVVEEAMSLLLGGRNTASSRQSSVCIPPTGKPHSIHVDMSELMLKIVVSGKARSRGCSAKSTKAP